MIGRKLEAMEMFDGLMLGDGGLVRHEGYGGMEDVQFRINLSAGEPDNWKGVPERNIPHMQYLQHLKVDCLEPLGISCCTSHPKSSIRRSCWGQLYLCFRLYSHSSEFLILQHKRWYRWITEEVRRDRNYSLRQKWYKILPSDVKITPITLTKWYEGDGTTRKDKIRGGMKLASHSFSKEENERLRDMLAELGIEVGVYVKDLHWWLETGAIGSANRLLDLIRPYIHECYQYKIFYHKYAIEQ